MYRVTFAILIACLPVVGQASVDISGSVRARYEALDNQYRATGSESDSQVAARTTLMLDYSANRWSVTAEMMDSRAFLLADDAIINTSIVNITEIIQARLNWITTDGKFRLSLGRFTQDLGTRRLVGRNNYRNTTNAFAGLLAKYGSGEDNRYTLFVASPLRIRPAAGPDLLSPRYETDNQDESSRLIAVHGLFQQVMGEFDAETYFLRLKEEDDKDEPTTNKKLNTLGVRLVKPRSGGEWDLDTEAIFQWGKRRQTNSPLDLDDLDVRAFLLSARAGFMPGDSQRWSLAFDVVSGDKALTNNRFERFDTLYGPSVPDFGFTGIYGAVSRANLIAPEVRWEFFGKQLDAYVAWRAIWLQSASDAFGRSGVHDPAGASGRFAAQQLHGQVRYWLIEQRVRLESGFALLVHEKFLRAAPNAPGFGDTSYVFTAINFSF